ncbi:hypothetical protein HPB50_028039 [Hyalomma asiaticum]|nr:hypothetical protein HPB50_028039 [Hyalomma asiaticum]
MRQTAGFRATNNACASSPPPVTFFGVLEKKNMGVNSSDLFNGEGSAFLTAVNQGYEPLMLPCGSSLTCAADTQPQAIVALSTGPPESKLPPPTTSTLPLGSVTATPRRK